MSRAKRKPARRSSRRAKRSTRKCRMYEIEFKWGDGKHPKNVKRCLTHTQMEDGVALDKLFKGKRVAFISPIHSKKEKDEIEVHEAAERHHARRAKRKRNLTIAGLSGGTLLFTGLGAAALYWAYQRRNA